jgi:hypothetical protein
MVSGVSRIRTANMTVLIEAPTNAPRTKTIIAVGGTHPLAVTQFHKVECHETPEVPVSSGYG